MRDEFMFMYDVLCILGNEYTCVKIQFDLIYYAFHHINYHGLTLLVLNTQHNKWCDL